MAGMPGSLGFNVFSSKMYKISGEEITNINWKC